MRLTETVALSLSEKDLQKQVRAMLDQFGWRTNVVHDSRHSPRGWPDIFAVRHVTPCHPGCWGMGTDHLTEAVAIELKSERGRVSAEQEAWLDLLCRLPGVKFAGVIRPSQWYAGELDDILR